MKLSQLIDTAKDWFAETDDDTEVVVETLDGQQFEMLAWKMAPIGNKLRVRINLDLASKKS